MLNVQADLRARLEAALDGVTVRVRVPETRPTTLVVVRRDGGSADAYSMLDRPGIGIDCWAPTEAKACALSEQVACAMAQLPFAGGYARVEQEACYSDYDTVAKSPRWYLSYTLTTYEPKE